MLSKKWYIHVMFVCRYIYLQKVVCHLIEVVVVYERDVQVN